MAISSLPSPSGGSDLKLEPIKAFIDLKVSDIILISGRKARVTAINLNTSIEIQWVGMVQSREWMYPLSLPRMFKVIYDGEAPKEEEEYESISASTITKTTDLEVGDIITYISEGGLHEVYLITTIASDLYVEGLSVAESNRKKTFYKTDIPFIIKVSRKKHKNKNNKVATYTLSDLDHKQFDLINEDYWEFVVKQLVKPAVKTVRYDYAALPSRDAIFNELRVDISKLNTLIVFPTRKASFMSIPMQSSMTNSLVVDFHKNLYKSLTDDYPNEALLKELITCDYLAKSGVLLYAKEFTRKVGCEVNFEETLQELVQYLAQKEAKFNLVLYKSDTEKFEELTKFISDNPEIEAQIEAIYIEDFSTLSVTGDWGYSNGYLYNHIPYAYAVQK